MRIIPATAPAPEGPARTAYAAVDRAKVFSRPDASASVLGVLQRNEKLARHQSENGFARARIRTLARLAHALELQGGTVARRALQVVA